MICLPIWIARIKDHKRGKGKVEYRGLKLHESVKLYKKDGEFNKPIKMGLDNLADKLEESNYKTIGFYVNTATNIKALCDKGHEIEIKPNNFVTKNRRCIKCDGQCPEEAKKKFYKLAKELRYTILDDYVNAVKSLNAICDKGHPTKIIPSTFSFNNTKCNECAKIEQSIRQSQEERKSFPLLVKSNGHILLTAYGKNCDEKVEINFNCGHKPSWIRPSVYKKIKTCPICSIDEGRKKRLKKSEEILIALINSNNHKLLSPFINVTEKVLVDFKCGHKAHRITPHKYKRGGGCPKCIKSHGVKIINDWLKENGINHCNEYKVLNKRWRYDIYIPCENLIVEVHGRQHYQFEEFFHRTKKQFIKEQENDRKKRKNAESLGYKYIEVDYREHKPELALERFLHQFNEIRGYKSKSMKVEQLSLF